MAVMERDQGYIHLEQVKHESSEVWPSEAAGHAGSGMSKDDH